MHPLAVNAQLLYQLLCLAWSKADIKAKKDSRINVFTIPKRSPDLNVLDYCIWTEIEKRMRRQERKMKDKSETREQFSKRLDKIAFDLPPALINKAIGNMRTRCQRLYKAEVLTSEGIFSSNARH